MTEDEKTRLAVLEARVKRLEGETLWRNPHLKPPYPLPGQAYGIAPRFGDPIEPATAIGGGPIPANTSRYP